jgi:uncharacterized membrane protein YkvA (DUF1232 family)
MTATIRRMAALKALAQVVRGARTPGAPSVGQRLHALPRMLSMGLSGRYPYLDKSRIAMAALALLYVLSPIDLEPEILLPLIGLGDDAFVAAWLAGTLLSETDTFLAWEKVADDPDVQVVVGEVIE